MPRPIISLLAIVACTGSALLLTATGAERRTSKPSVSAAEEKQVIDHLDWMQKNQSKGMLNVPPEDGKLLRIFAESSRARNAVEIGTSNGYSGTWICLGLKSAGGRLTTFEIDEERYKLARENFKKAGVDGMVTQVLGDAHKEIGKLKEPIDLLFIDAEKPGYLDYFNKLLPLVRPGGLILAHNTTNSAADLKDYVKAITTTPDLETVFVNATDRGMGITMKKR